MQTEESHLQPYYQRADSADTPGHIMIVDDSREVAGALAALLQLSGHTVELFNDGRRALAAVAIHPPDLVILDVQMPDLDGYTVCAALKHAPATWCIPVIMVTVEDEREARLQGIEAGADDYLSKPVDARELEVRVRVLLRNKRRTDGLEQAEAVIFALARTVEAKDAYTEGHLRRLARYTASCSSTRSSASGSSSLCVSPRLSARSCDTTTNDGMAVATPTAWRAMPSRSARASSPSPTPSTR